MPLDPVLAKIPGLAGYQAMDSYNRDQELQDAQKIGITAKLADHFREENFRRGLTPDMSSDDVLKRAYQYLGPEKAATLAQAHQDKQAQREMTTQIAKQRIDNQYAMFSQKLPLIADAEQRKQAQLQLDQWYKDAHIQATRGNAEFNLPMDIFNKTMGTVGAAPSVAAPGGAGTVRPPVTMPQQGAMPDRQPVGAPSAGGGPMPRGLREDPVAAGNTALATLSAEAQKYTDSGQPVPADLAAEIAKAKTLASGQYPKSANPVPTREGLGEVPAPLPGGAPAVVQTPGGTVPISRAEQARRDRQQQLPPLVGDDLVSAGSQHASGQPLTQIVPGYGAKLGDRREEVRKEAIRQIRAENPQMTAAQAGQELVNRQIAKIASQSSVGQLEKMKGATIQAVKQLEFNVDQVTAEMKKLGGGGIKDLSPLFTAIARGEEKWTGDPAYSALYLYMYATATESARIMSGGQASIAQLHQGAADEAKKWANADWTTPKQWAEGVAPAMKKEAEARIGTFNGAIKMQRLGGGGEQTPTRTAAPQQAIDFLKATPTVAMKEAFKKKYGYLPDGI